MQNLQAVKTGSLVFFILNFSLRAICTVFPEEILRAANYPEYNITNWVYIAITPLFYFLSLRLELLFKKTQRIPAGTQVLIMAFSLYIIFSGMMATFIAMYDPRNTLTLYLIALITVSVLCVFEYEDSLMLTLGTGVLFTILLFVFKTDPTEVVYNQLVSLIILTGFYFISRYVFSYKSSHYIQLVQIQEKNIEIEKGSAFKNDVLGMVAHDLRNPIGAIESIAMIAELGGELDDDMQDNVNMIKASCMKARTIIEDLLEVARNDSSNVIITNRLDVNQLLEHIVADWKNQDIRNKVMFKGTTAPVFAEINPEKFHRVVDNLISNAVKFSKDSDTVDVVLSQAKGKVVIEVRDYGLGIPKDMVPHIFERFSKAGRQGVHGEQSTGLGLSIARQIVERHRGTIEVHSEEQQGSTFRIHIPEVVN
jgi:two-component system sensor histidine kinase VicK